MNGRARGYWLIVLSFAIALLLTIMPLPDWARPFRPQWVTLTLIYWCLALPHRVGVITGFILGILLDVSTGTLLGQHAMSLAIVAWLVLKLHRRIRLFPVWQQALTVLILLVLHQLLTLWISHIIGRPGTPWYYWAPSITGMLVWPFILTVAPWCRVFHHLTEK